MVINDGHIEFNLDLESDRWCTQADQMSKVMPILARMVYKALYNVNSSQIIKIFITQTSELTDIFFDEYARHIERELKEEEGQEDSSVRYITTPESHEVSYKESMVRKPTESG